MGPQPQTKTLLGHQLSVRAWGILVRAKPAITSDNDILSFLDNPRAFESSLGLGKKTHNEIRQAMADAGHEVGHYNRYGEVMAKPKKARPDRELGTSVYFAVSEIDELLKLDGAPQWLVSKLETAKKKAR